MNDRELLELAAKAANMDIFWCDCISYNCKTGEEWNPLTDDGNALRLAVKLGFSISINRGEEKVVIETGSDDENHFHIEKYQLENEESHVSATRRAIVRAAAEIGKGMK